MDTPLEPQEIRRHLGNLSSRQKRALGRAGFRVRALATLAMLTDGAPMAEAVLACHTDALGRPPRPGEAELADAALHRLNARRELREPVLEGWDLRPSKRSKLEGTPEQLAEIEALRKAKREVDQAAARDDRDGPPHG